VAVPLEQIDGEVQKGWRALQRRSRSRVFGRAFH
jgi:hypothetical protein